MPEGDTKPLNDPWKLEMNAPTKSMTDRMAESFMAQKLIFTMCLNLLRK